jgi:RHS repeat-associated protein
MPSGRVINYNYEAGKSRLSSIHIAGNPFISNIAYDGLGQLSSWNIEGTGANYTIGYDPSRNGAIKSVHFTNKNGGASYAEEYGFDQDGRIVTLNKLNNYSRIITYDKASRLTDEQNAWYVYDKNGNRIEGPNKYSFYTDKSRNQLHLVYNFDYDVLMTANYLTTGEMIPDSFLSSYSGNGVVHYNSSLPGYDGNGQMRYSGGETAQYYMAYNHKNERTVRSSSASGSYYTGAVQFVYDESSNLIGEYAPDGTPIVEYVWMGSHPVAAIYGTGAGKTYAVVTDHNATPRMLVDNATNAAVWQWESTAFGVGKPTGSVKFNLRFPGQYYDELTGLHYNLNRYYIPELGRYMEPDPIGLEGGLNPYVYADNNPLSNVDPSGQAVEAADQKPAWQIGIMAHSLLSNWINFNYNMKGNFNWKSELSFNTLGRSGRADLTYFDPKQKIGSIWELKPMSYGSGIKFGQTVNQIQGYIFQAQKQYGGNWSAGVQAGNPLPFTNLTLTGLVGMTPYRFDYIVQNPQAGLLGYNATPISFGDYLGVPFFNFDSAINLNLNGKFDYGYNNSSGSGGVFPSAPGMMPIIP